MENIEKVSLIPFMKVRKEIYNDTKYFCEYFKKDYINKFKEIEVIINIIVKRLGNKFKKGWNFLNLIHDNENHYIVFYNRNKYPDNISINWLLMRENEVLPNLAFFDDKGVLDYLTIQNGLDFMNNSKIESIQDKRIYNIIKESYIDKFVKNEIFLLEV